MNSLVVDGFKLLVLGMSGVFLFLAIMVVMISLAAKLIAPFAHLLEPPPEPPRKPKKDTGKGDDSRLAAAAVAAVHMHRQQGK